MKNPEVLIINKNEKHRRIIGDILKAYSVSFPLTVRDECSIEDYRKHGSGKLQICFIPSDSRNKYLEIARDISENFPHVNIIVSSLKQTRPYDTETSHHPELIKGRIYKENTLEDTCSILDESRRKRDIFQELGVAILGLGDIGKETVRLFKRKSWLDTLDLYSPSVDEIRATKKKTMFSHHDDSFSYENIIRSLSLFEMRHSGRLRTHLSIRSFAEFIEERDVDVLIISTGEHLSGRKYIQGDRTNRDSLIKFEERCFNKTWVKIAELSLELGKLGYTNLLFNMISTPNSELSMIPKNLINGLPKDHIFSSTPDGRRSIRLMWGFLHKLYGLTQNPVLENLPASDIELNVFGEHRDPIVPFSSCYINRINQDLGKISFFNLINYIRSDQTSLSRDAKDYLDRLESKKFTEDFIYNLKKIGSETQMSAKLSRTGPSETPESILDTLEMLAYGFEKMPSSMTHSIYYPQEDAYVQIPIKPIERFDIKDIRISPDMDSIYKLPEKDIILNKLKQQSRFQKDFYSWFEKYISNYTKKWSTK